MKKKVLFIEDDPIDQMAIKRFIKEHREEYQFDMVPSVVEAREKLDSSPYDIVFIDFTLSDGTGFDVFDFINNAPFVVMTGGGSEQIAVEALKCGAADYLVKDPAQRHLAVLPTVIESTIKNYKAQQKINLLQQALTTVPDSVFITDLEAKIVYVNEAFLKTYGYSETEIMGLPCRMLWSVPEKAHIDEQDIFHKRKNGSVFPVLLSRSVVKNNDGVEINIVTVVHDITERKRMEVSLQDAIQKYTLLLDHVENENIKLKKEARP